MSDGLYPDLVQAVKSGRAIIVVGTGVSIGATGSAPSTSWRGLLRSGLTRVKTLDPNLRVDWARRVREEIDSDDPEDLLTAAEKISRRLDAPAGGEFRNWLRGSFESVPVLERAVPQAIAALNLPILTTNYDDVLQSVVDGPPVTWRQPEDLQRVIRGDLKSVGHLHGHYRDPESVVLGIRSYERALAAPALQALQHAISMMSTLIFVGMGSGLDDPNWSALFHFVRQSVPNSEYRHYRLCEDSELNDLSSKHRDSPIFPVSFGVKSMLANFVRRLAEESGRPQPPPTKPSAANVALKPPSSDHHDAQLDSNSSVRLALGIIRDSTAKSVVLVQPRYTETLLEWGFPAGFVKTGHDPRQVLKREIRQETGLTCRPVKLIGERVHPLTGLRCLYFEMNVLDGKLKNGDQEENLDVRWVRVSRLYNYIAKDLIYEPVRAFLNSDER